MNTITSSPVLFPVRKPLHPAPIIRWLPGDTPTDNKPFRMVSATYMETASHLDNPGCCALIDPNWIQDHHKPFLALANAANPYLPHGGPLDPISPPEPKPVSMAIKELRAAFSFQGTQP